MNLTKEEIIFLINVLAEINVPVKNPNAVQIATQAQSCINKLSKMIDEVKDSKSLEKLKIDK